ADCEAADARRRELGARAVDRRAANRRSVVSEQYQPPLLGCGSAAHPKNWGHAPRAGGIGGAAWAGERAVREGRDVDERHEMGSRSGHPFHGVAAQLESGQVTPWTSAEKTGSR